MKSKISWKTRVHEWLADRVPGVQYPDIKPLTPRQKQPFFKHQMPWEKRMFLFFFGICGIAIGGVILSVFGLMIWAFLFG